MCSIGIGTFTKGNLQESDRTMGREFYEYDTDELDFAPFDIETTGFKAGDDDVITTFVMHHDGKYHVWLNTDGNHANRDEIKADIIEASGLDNVLLYLCETEGLLQENVREYLDLQADATTVLVAFNGEGYHTGFDVPFLRTRCLRNGVPWMLGGHWYTDPYDVLVDQNRLDTTVTEDPTLDSLNTGDIKDFVDWAGYDIPYDSLLKAELSSAIESDSEATPEKIESWADNNNISGVDGQNPSTLGAKKNLKSLVDDLGLDIHYGSMSQGEIIERIHEQNFDDEMILEWYDDIGQELGKEEAGSLDDIHEKLIEDVQSDSEWQRGLPFDVEVFEPFDPFDDSEKAVAAHENGDYADLILHCLADVARTVNLTRVMVEYTPKSDYRPKTL